jgi:regulation of enolase protein 1 (concanavalin A-like superfamily)
VPDWAGRRITVRASRDGTAITVRAGRSGEDLRLIRLVPFAADLDAQAGPLVCAPTRAGLQVPLHRWRLTEPDAGLHP